jgi:hypothetical protein
MKDNNGNRNLEMKSGAAKQLKMSKASAMSENGENGGSAASSAEEISISKGNMAASAAAKMS